MYTFLACDGPPVKQGVATLNAEKRENIVHGALYLFSREIRRLSMLD